MAARVITIGDVIL